MKKDKKNLLRVLHGEKPEQVPIWLMRQAGRYLPEYRGLRARAESFMKLCLSPEWAAEVTLQPVKRFGMDGAILFSDILMVPYGLGYALEVVQGKGPVLEKVSGRIPEFNPGKFFERVAPVFETVKRITQEIPENTALIGFCGGPWTVACYMLGESKDEFSAARSKAQSDPGFFKGLLDILVESSVFYLSGQIKAGAEVIQIFDSHAGLAPEESYADFIIVPTRKIVAQLREKFPEIPAIGFPRGSSRENLLRYGKDTGVTALSLDGAMDLSWAQQNLPCILQGNLDPKFMEGEKEPMLAAAEAILKTMQKPFIFNLGHGLSPQARPENVAALVKFVQGWRA